MGVFDENWLKTKASITEKTIFLFNNDLLSDVSLVVRASNDEGGKKSKMAIPAHKFVLSTCSPVFFAMFSGKMEMRAKSVDLPDCEYGGMLEMLRYMYSGAAELNENNVMQVLYVAKKYIVTSLADECVRFLQSELDPENVFSALPHAQQYDEKILVDQCWEVIDRETEDVVKSEEFATGKSLPEEIPKRDTTLKASITEQSIFMFNSDLLSDVSLVVRASSDEDEPKKSKMAIPAHRFVLSMCSPVFFAMFCGKMAMTAKSVDLPDCDYEGVLEMLRYMYGGEAELDESNVMRVLYVAKKYIVTSLADECVRFLQRELDLDNVFCVLQHAHQYDEKILVDQCWEVIDRETEEALKSEEFATIQRCLLEEIVKRDSLTIREVELFKAVDLWATKECERQGLTPNGDVKRRILGDMIVKQIRFPVMEEKEFTGVVLGSGILTQQEVVNLVEHFNSSLKSPVGFRGDKRVGALRSCFRFLNVGCCFESYDKEYSFHLCVDNDIVLHGIRLFGSADNDYEVTLTVEKVEGGVIVNKTGKFSSVLMHRKDICYYGFDVMFDPVNMRKDIYYLVKAEVKGPPR